MVWIVVHDAIEMTDCIKNMSLRGAPLLGIAAGYGLALEAQKKGKTGSALLSHLEDSGKMLGKARPTAVNLAWAIQRMLERARKDSHLGKALGDILREEALSLHEEDRQACSAIGQWGAQVLPQGNVLTHCNTGALATGGDGTAYSVLKEGFRQGKVTRVFACEARPFLQGARLTAFELKQDKIPFTLITDSMAGYFMWQGKIQAVVVGADRVARNGDVANKIGTYALAVLAHENKIPFFVAAPTSTLDPSLETGQGIPIEERDKKEVVEIMGVSIAPEGIEVAHPAFDISPARYVNAIITEKGIALPPFSESLSKLMQGGNSVAAI